MIIDIYSRYVPGWMLAHAENARLAEALLADTVTKQNIGHGQLTIHADRGSPMVAKPVAFLLADLGVTKSHSRPHTSNDNPFSESQFRTLKYRPEFPDRFGCYEDAHAFCSRFFGWYNDEHRHSGIGFHTPADVHYGRAERSASKRAIVLNDAYAAHPERFVRKPPQPPALPTAVWINEPKEDTHDTVILKNLPQKGWARVRARRLPVDGASLLDCPARTSVDCAPLPLLYGCGRRRHCHRLRPAVADASSPSLSVRLT